MTGMTGTACWIAWVFAFAPPPADDWRRPYGPAESRAPHVLALWNFDVAEPLADASGRGHRLELAGATAEPDGRFGGGLRSYPGWPVKDERHAATARHHPDLSPSGAFTIDLWVKPAADLPARANCHLLCKKYVSHRDYQLLFPAVEGDKRRLILNLGFGVDSESFASEPVAWPVDVWQHVAVVYDGEGSVRFYRNGASIGGRTAAGRRSVSAGTLPLSIGDRTGSSYGGFSGVIDQVRLSAGVREFSPLYVEWQAPRATYLRRETSPSPSATAVVYNRSETPATAVQVVLTGAGPPRSRLVERIEPGASASVEYPLDLALRPDVYRLRARVASTDDPTADAESTFLLTIAPRPAPRMPVMMWGIGGPQEYERERDRLRRLGFTHFLGFSADYAAAWDAREPPAPDRPEKIAEVRRMLDSALAAQLGVAAQLSPGEYLQHREELRRVDREGRPYPRSDVDAALPGLDAFCERVGAGVARAYGDHPAFAAALINTEVRDDAEVSFSPAARAACRAATGRDVPEVVRTKYGVDWKSLPDFPADRVVPDDDPILAFYRWYWTVGDGWNGLHSAVHRGLHSTGRDDLWTWYDPAIRAPSVAGSGGDVDVLGQWSYTEPGPLRVGYFCDELFAMASVARRPPRVMKMTQLFWYRSSSAPAGAANAGRPADGSPAAAFDDHDPDAAYISISPTHLRESFWTKLSRPVSGLMYHGWGSLVPTDGTHPYKHTQLDLEAEFERLHRELLPSLGPLLLQVPDAPTDVAYLDSFTAQMFARRGSYGYSHDEAYLTLLHAQLQPRVVYEESILRGALDGVRLLVLVDCDVLPAGVVRRIVEFQRAGGLVVGDPNVAPAIKPDVVLPRYVRTKRAAEDKVALLAAAEKLRAAIDGRYVRPVESSNPEVVVRRRRRGDGDYVFVTNDRREAGDYVGRFGLVQEVGAPSDAQVTLRRAPGRVYDLLAGRPVQTTERDGALQWPVSLDGGDGGLYLVVSRPLDRLAIESLDRVRTGESLDVRLQILADDDRPIDASIPVRVDVFDPHGRPAEGTGWYAAADGRLDLRLDLAPNDVPGVWTIRARETASGLSARRHVRVERSEPLGKTEPLEKPVRP